MSNEVKELVLEACNEFVQCVASEANEISTADNKSTIAPEHVVRALESLDFQGYVERVNETWAEMKTEGKEARAEKKKKKGMQMTPEEALAMQQRMFAEARARYNSGDSSGPVGGVGGVGGAPPPPPPPRPMGGVVPQVQVPPPTLTAVSGGGVVSSVSGTGGGIAAATTYGAAVLPGGGGGGLAGGGLSLGGATMTPGPSSVSQLSTAAAPVPGPLPMVSAAPADPPALVPPSVPAPAAPTGAPQCPAPVPAPDDQVSGGQAQAQTAALTEQAPIIALGCLD